MGFSATQKQGSSLIFSEALTITSVAPSAPVNPTLTAVSLNIIDVIDDGSGYCSLALNLEKAAGGNGGYGDYLVLLPGGLKFNTVFHPPYAVLGDPGLSGKTAWIPGSHGTIANGGIRVSCYASVWDATHFRIHAGAEGLYSGYGGIRSPWSSSVFIASDALSIQHAFRFKKG